MKASDYIEGKGGKREGKTEKRERQMCKEGKEGTRPERVEGDQ